ASLAGAPAYLNDAAAGGPPSGNAGGEAHDGTLPPAAARGDAGVDAATGSVADLTVRLLGPIEVYRDAQRKIPTQARTTMKRAIQVFCFLVVAPGHRATRDALADALWVNARPSAIERHFDPTISFLRR